MGVDVDSRLYYSSSGLKEKYQREDIYINGSKQSMYMCNKCSKNLLIKELPIKISINGSVVVDKLNICPKCGRIFIEEKGNKLRSCYSYADFHNGLERLEYLFKIVDEKKQTYDTDKYNISSSKNIYDAWIWKLRNKTIKNISSVTKMRVIGTNQTYHVGMGDELPQELLPGELQIGNFYVGNYHCPECGLAMYKTVFPVGGEFPIEIKNGHTHYMKRVYTCRDCMHFYTAKQDLLSDGEVYEIEFGSVQQYDRYFDELDRRGTTQGRPD